jgi:hypothetical protein
LDVVAHQEEFVYFVLVGRMHCYLGWWEREDQPAMTCIDRLVLEHSLKNARSASGSVL